jgi:hypothetical protein
MKKIEKNHQIIHLNKLTINGLIYRSGTLIGNYIVANIIHNPTKIFILFLNKTNINKFKIFEIDRNTNYINKEKDNTYTLIGKTAKKNIDGHIFIHKFENFKILFKNLKKKLIINNNTTIINQNKSAYQNNVDCYFDSLINKVTINNKNYIYARYNPFIQIRKYQVFIESSDFNYNQGIMLNFFNNEIELDVNINIYDGTIFNVNNEIYGFFGYYYPKKKSKSKFYLYQNMKIMLAVSKDGINFNILNKNIIGDYSFYTHGFVMNNNYNNDISKIYFLNSKGNILTYKLEDNYNYKKINELFNLNNNAILNKITNIITNNKNKKNNNKKDNKKNNKKDNKKNNKKNNKMDNDKIYIKKNINLYKIKYIRLNKKR